MTSIPRPRHDQQHPTAVHQVVLGVDTHKDIHVAAVLTDTGGVLDDASFPTTAAGYQQLLDWARGHGRLRRAGVECTGSYGKALTRYLRAEGIDVTEVNTPDKATRRRRGKTDTIDAQAAATAVINGRATAVPKHGDGAAEMLRVLKLTKDSAIKSRTQALNQLKAILITAEPALRESVTGTTSVRTVQQCAALLTITPTDATSTTAYTLRLLAERILTLTAEVRALKKQMTAVITRHAPQLLEPAGIGYDSAAALLITAGDNPERLASEASFAALCGVSPVEASSGKTQRRRLNRGGDRQANAALYRIAMSRLRWHPPTRAYLERRLTEGKTRREALRCLKRYIAREIYRLLQPPAQTTTVAA